MKTNYQTTGGAEIYSPVVAERLAVFKRLKIYFRDSGYRGNKNIMNNQINYKEFFTHYPDVLSVGQLMEMPHIGKVLAYKLLRSGRIISMKVGREYKIAKVHLIEFLLNRPEADAR